jgi:hypothetical protein
MTIQDDFSAEIEAFLERHDMKPAVFGQQALHDPKFVFDLRQGRSPSIKTIEKVRAWMAEQEAEGGAPAATPAAIASSEPEPRPERQPPAPAGRGHGRRTIVIAAVVLVLVAGAAVVWQQRLLHGMASGMYHRVIGRTDTGDGMAFEQFAAVVAAVQNDFNGLRRDLQEQKGRIARLEQQDGDAGGPPLDSARIDRLEERIAALETRPVTESPSALSSGDVAALRARIDQLQESVDSLQARQQELAGLDGRMTALKDELDSLTSGLTDITGLQAGIKESAVISAFLRLDAEVRSGRPYAAALSLYQKQVELQAGQGDWPTGDALAAGAATGIATTPSLQDRLEALIPRILAAREDGNGWTDRLLSRLRGIVVVRKTGEPEGDAPQAIVARAETRLAAGDLEGALAQMESLPAARKAVAAPWLAQAQARLDALDTLAGMAAAIGNAQGS